ncbi:leucine zipper putative tumor suppressor 3 [Pristis pectinata]|uniref:leucine zipper putative tumor suppressor 3 n=1 Tax=Pristis pectinata TaxID=685728 RepID=UPI00223CED7B|nr:leucine zipper putative tumor suppressor 3 [Pristis pectinata]XP_051866319.1 leucine zipper putative tumor suppressor 3 [Pristis pectinata]XP_051866320.1 leucine zipper putative tumor suppressor 3 [Pristis pectinata]XP_051866321.1 leucine zipper putative tumor suppressor 3 [Pristis pectinata]XP_051866322.1 leucine zipper putative tumor suppressor 3 [Pristis pectinata]XP_051866323.1 leucine zipper putative tumor suppressor 3 [Pristis pectinata]XP_051866324.1 leucine zipper putative tumor su
MAKLQMLSTTSDPGYHGCETYPVFAPRSADPGYSQGTMGSVGSGVANEQEFAMKSMNSNNRPGLVQNSSRQQDGLRNSYTSREFSKRFSSEEKCFNPENMSNSLYINGDRRIGDRTKTDVTNNNEKNMPPQYREPSNPPKILPVSGKLEQTSESLIRPSAFKPVVPKNFHSMQNLCPPQTNGITDSRKTLSAHHTNSSSPSGGRVGMDKAGHGRTLNHSGGMSDSGRNSLTSLPTYGSGYSQHIGPMSASTSHINRLGTSYGDRGVLGYNGISTSDSGRSSSKSVSSFNKLNHMHDTLAYHSPSNDDIIQDLEDRLWEKEQEVIQMRRSLDKSEAAIVQVFEEKQKIWEREMEDLKQNYANKLQQVSKKAQRSQQALQLQIFKLQQEKKKLQEDVGQLLQQREELEKKCLTFKKEQSELLPRLEETKWEVCQKAGEISLMKQQMKDSQADVAQKLNEMVVLRTQLKEATSALRAKEEQVLTLKDSFNAKGIELEVCENELQRKASEAQLLREKLGQNEAEISGLKQALADVGQQTRCGEEGPEEQRDELACESDEAKMQRQSEDAVKALKKQIERLQGELRLERQQHEQQLSHFEEERQTWQEEKEKVIKYQKQLQLNYVEMYQKNQALESKLNELNTTANSPTADDMKQWTPSRLERIESTEI